MTHSKFKKLVNLYLDKEITSRDLQLLKETIRVNLVLQNEFKRMCKMHAAERKALVEHAQKSGIRRVLHEDMRSVEVSGYSSDPDAKTTKGSRIRRRTLKEREKEKRNFFIFQFGSLAAMICLLLVGSYFYMVQKEQAATARHMPLVDGQELPLRNFQLALETMESPASDFLLIMDEGNGGLTNRMLIASAEGTPLFYLSPVDPDASAPLPAGELARFLQAVRLDFPTLSEYAAAKRSSMFSPMELPGTSAPASIRSAVEEQFRFSLADLD